jgi:carotenoid cleavage dioxygenase-like enzyme
MFAQEPQFIPSPNPTSEDDGVLLVQGVDGTKNKGNDKLTVFPNKALPVSTFNCKENYHQNTFGSKSHI